MGISFTPYFIVGMATGLISNAIYIFLGGKFQCIIDEMREGNFFTWEMGFFFVSLAGCIAGCAGITIMVHNSLLKEQKYEITEI